MVEGEGEGEVEGEGWRGIKVGWDGMGWVGMG